jgi:poly(hydroxyalkanoate) depolymerase family esterase
VDQHRLTRMAEATRLTRQGRLAEAVALLRSGPNGVIDPTPPQSPHLPDGPPMPDGLRSLVLGHPAAARPASTAPGQFLDRAYGSGAAERSYKIYVPTGYAGGPVPLVVMLHGGTQNADDFAAGTGLNDLAERHTFLVAYPEQSRTANPMGYWNWFQPADQRRGEGEPAVIAGITARIADTYAVDQGSVFVAGFSAGGAMAAVMAAAYPDVFAAVGVHSGLAAGAAHDVPSAFAAMRAGVSNPHRTSVPLIVFHGDADPTVAPVNADCLIRAAVPAAGRPAVTETHQAPGGRRYTRTVHVDAGGTPVAEQWMIHGAGHAWSGGKPDGTYTDPQGPEASAELTRFFAEHARSVTPASTATPAGHPTA